MSVPLLPSQTRPELISVPFVVTCTCLLMGRCGERSLLEAEVGAGQVGCTCLLRYGTCVATMWPGHTCPSNRELPSSFEPHWPCVHHCPECSCSTPAFDAGLAALSTCLNHEKQKHLKILKDFLIFGFKAITWYWQQMKVFWFS